MTPEFRAGLLQSARALQVDPVDLATVISYETAGTFDPAKRGPTTQWGQHRGLIQFGEPQAKQYGVDWNRPLESQLGADGAVVRYLTDRGFKPGGSLLDLYSTINAGAPGLYDRTDANNGGAPGTVREKVEGQFGPHRTNAERLLGMDKPVSDFARRFVQPVQEKPAVSDFARRYVSPQKPDAPVDQKSEGDPQSYGAGVLDSFTQGMTFGFGDELTALENALLGGTDSETFWEEYDRFLRAERGQQRRFGKENPVTSTVAEISGSIAAPMGAIRAPGAIGSAARAGERLVTGAATKAGAIARAAGAGTAAGSLYALGDSDRENFDSTAGDVATGAGLGAVGGVVGREIGIAAQRIFRRIISDKSMFDGKRLTAQGKAALSAAGIDPAQISDDFAARFAARVQQAGGNPADPAAAARLAQADEFGIPLTRGQATQDVPQIAYEEASRNYARGARAGEIVSGIDNRARAATGDVVERLSRNVDDPYGASERVTEGVRGAAREAEQAYQNAYRSSEVGLARVEGANSAAQTPTRRPPVDNPDDFREQMDAEALAADRSQIDAFNDARAAIAREASQGARRPVTEAIKRMGGIDPDSVAAAELRSMGYNERSYPGLFRAGGMKDVDNLPIDELDGDAAEALSRDGFYADRQGVLDALETELRSRGGNAVRSAAEDQLDELDRFAPNEARARVAAAPAPRPENSRLFGGDDFVAGVRARLDGLDISSDARNARNAMRELEAFGNREVGASLEQIDAVRKQMVRYRTAANAGNNEADARAMNAVMAEFDATLDRVFDEGLFSGSPEALEKLKAARVAFADYKRRFYPSDTSDDAGKLIQRMIERDVTPQEVANMLYGASKVGAKGSSVRLVRRLKEILPEADMDAIRGGAIRRIARGNPGPQKLANNIAEFLSGEGAAMARELFNPEQIAEMRRFEKALRILIPPPSATNPSKTSYGVARMMGDTWGNMAAMLGFATAGPAAGIGAKLAASGSRGLVDGIKAGSIPARLGTARNGGGVGAAAGGAAASQVAP